jgi:DNA-binding beta-propeller fold protein YncE
VIGTYLIGAKHVRGIVTADSSLLKEANFGSNAVAVYCIDAGRVIGTVSVGDRPDALALTSNEDFLLVLDSESDDVAVVRMKKLATTSKISAPRALYTLVGVGIHPNDIAVKSFSVRESGQPNALGRPSR